MLIKFAADKIWEMSILLKRKRKKKEKKDKRMKRNKNSKEKKTYEVENITTQN